MKSDRRKRAAEALRSLKRRPEIAAVTRAAARRGVDAWIVGGALRDRLLGLTVEEVDVAVARDVEAIAADLERAGRGRAVFLSRGKPGPPVFRLAGPRPFDAAEIEGGTIAADLGRRDYTVNALALPLPSGELLDPFGGLADAAARRLRCVRPENLAEDPLRILRAARLFATRGLVPDAGVLAASRAAAGLFPRAAPERVGAELAKLLEAPRAAPALAWTGRAGILPAVLGLPIAPRRALGGRRGRSPRSTTRRSAAFRPSAGASCGSPASPCGWGSPPTGRARGSENGAGAARKPATRRSWSGSWAARAGPVPARRPGAGSSMRAGSCPTPSPSSRRALRRRDGAPAACDASPRTRRPPVAVDGRDVVRWLGIARGPARGRVAARPAGGGGHGSGLRTPLGAELADRTGPEGAVTGYNPYTLTLAELLKFMAKKEASDLHLKPMQTPPLADQGPARFP